MSNNSNLQVFFEQVEGNCIFNQNLKPTSKLDTEFFESYYYELSSKEHDLVNKIFEKALDKDNDKRISVSCLNNVLDRCLNYIVCKVAKERENNLKKGEELEADLKKKFKVAFEKEINKYVSISCLNDILNYIVCKVTQEREKDLKKGEELEAALGKIDAQCRELDINKLPKNYEELIDLIEVREDYYISPCYCIDLIDTDDVTIDRFSIVKSENLHDFSNSLHNPPEYEDIAKQLRYYPDATTFIIFKAKVSEYYEKNLLKQDVYSFISLLRICLMQYIPETPKNEFYKDITERSSYADPAITYHPNYYLSSEAIKIIKPVIGKIFPKLDKRHICALDWMTRGRITDDSTEKLLFCQIALEILCSGDKYKNINDIKKIIDSNKFDNDKLMKIKEITDAFKSIKDSVVARTHDITGIDTECLENIMRSAQELRSGTVHSGKLHDFKQNANILQVICEQFLIEELGIKKAP